MLLFLGGRYGDRASRCFDEIGPRADYPVSLNFCHSAVRWEYLSHDRGEAMGITHVLFFNL